MGKLYSLLCVLLLPFVSNAQIVWDFSTATPLSGVPAGITVSAVSQGNNNGTTTLLTTTSASSAYPGATGGNNAGAAANVGGYRPDTTTYFEWTLTPAAGVAVTVTQISFGSRSTGTGPQAYDIRTSLDNFAAPAATGSLANNSAWALISSPTALPGTPGQAITIRIYAYNGTGNASKNTANWRIDDLSVLATASGNVPVPAITVFPASLSGFAAVAGSASPAQTITVGGVNLTAGISATASAGFELSRDGSNFSATVGLAQTGGTVADTALLVRLAAGAPSGVVNGTVTLRSAGADSTLVQLTGSVTSPAAKVVVNQVYGGGGNSGSVFSNDFIELFNDADTAVNLNGWSVQYSSSAGTSWQVTPLTGTIPPHGFFLVQEAVGASPNTPLPAPDVIGSIAMSATTGKVLLSNAAAAQTGADPSGATVIDLVGYGPGATGFEGAPAPVLTNSTADVRVPDGGDSGNNATDFQVNTPNPRNSTYTTAPPMVQSLVPVNGAASIPSSVVPVLVFTKPVAKGVGNITLVVNGTDSTVIPVSDTRIAVSNDSVVLHVSLVGGNTYAIRIGAGTFVDAFGNAFAGLSSGWSFSTYNNTIAQTLPYATSFDSCLGSGLLPNGFTAFSVTGAQVWDCTTFGRDSSNLAGTTAFGHAIEINGFAGGVNNPNQDWLISPRFNLAGTTYPLLNFWSRNAFTGAPLTLEVSTDYTGSGNPTLAHWAVLNGKFPSVASDVWTLSSNIDLSTLKDSTVYFAFVYTSSDQDGSRWTVDDVSLVNSLTPPPPSLTLSTDNFEFGYTAFRSVATQKLLVTGNDLTSPITITGSSVFQVSTDSVHFSDSVSLTAAVANNKTLPVYIRFIPEASNRQFIDSVLVLISDSTAVVNVKGNSIDPASTLSVIDWNLNWFGTPDPTLGPTDKALQKRNVGTVLPSLHADLYALEEVCDEAALDSIVATMPGYAVIVGQFGSFSNPTIPGGPDPINTIQKLAFVYNTAKITAIRTDSLLTLGTSNPLDPSTTYYNDWSSGRFPYMLTASVTLSDNQGGTNTQTFRFINVHAKANTSPVLTAYARRADGARALDSLLKAQYPSDNVVILGDFNDDLNQTITAGVNPPVTSWSAFTIGDSSLYKFPTQPLSPTGQHSDVNYSSVIDNVIISDTVNRFYLPASATVRSDVAGLVTNYGTTTTDHYPVYTQFSFTPPATGPIRPPLIFTGQKQGSTALLTWITTPDNDTKVFEVQKSLDGRVFLPIGLVAARSSNATDTATTYNFTDPLPLPGTDYYRLKEIESIGNSTLSNTVSLTFPLPLTLTISPNPAFGSTRAIVAHADGPYVIQVLNLSGTTLKQQTGTPDAQVNTISLSGLRAGIYVVKVTTSDQVGTGMLLVL
ncbi:MAG TPA: choice-of-anchor J domain-containing protein [Dinghuibacter sp.]|uniref:T9SS-dependent choice-of-anchor J family protein n=1 Tax=Dinghuibacter sp. TaxID=2024697 RepID=UPI002BB6D6F9|nr:choice-of-anchor J domain-containing protein [Dinghuibacter sp.]HTJ12640.1 choice-of-anchor J domain-containing protein [Dinghuibacter sp.]